MKRTTHNASRMRLSKKVILRDPEEIQKQLRHSGQHTTQLIVALDVDNLKEAERLIESLYPTVRIFKVGMQLFTAAGPRAVRMVRQMGGEVFLDLKFYDLPNTVANAVRQAVGLRIFMLDVHIQGGEEMLKAAVGAARAQAEKLRIRPPLILGITVLTSRRGGTKIKQLVLSQARRGRRCGLDGVVASVHEAHLLRENLGRDFVLVTPGIRPKGSTPFDQKRIATPRQAVLSGSNYLVVGRPIIKARHPLGVAKDIIEQISPIL